jgi:hypothetical protein
LYCITLLDRAMQPSFRNQDPKVTQIHTLWTHVTNKISTNSYFVKDTHIKDFIFFGSYMLHHSLPVENFLKELQILFNI